MKTVSSFLMFCGGVTLIGSASAQSVPALDRVGIDKSRGIAASVRVADVPLVFTSGYVRPEEVEPLRAFAHSAIVLKPDLVTGLASALHRLLAHSSGTKTDTRGSGPTSRVM